MLSADRAGQIPTTYGYNFGIQQAMPYKMVFDISYVGNVSRHQLYDQELKQLPPGYTTSSNILATVNNVSAAILPYKGYTSIHYNKFGADYTFSKAIDLEDVDTDFDVFPDYTQLKRLYAPASFDRRNVFNFQHVYNLPQFKGHNKLIQLSAGGCEYSGVTKVWSDSPCLAGNGPTGDSGALSSSGNLGDGGFGYIRPTTLAARFLLRIPTTFQRGSRRTGLIQLSSLRLQIAASATSTVTPSMGQASRNWNMSLLKNLTSPRAHVFSYASKLLTSLTTPSGGT